MEHPTGFNAHTTGFNDSPSAGRPALPSRPGGQGSILHPVSFRPFQLPITKKWQTMLAPASDLQPPPTPLATPPPPRPSLCRHAPLRICQGADQRRFDGSSRSPNSRRSVASSVRIYFELVAKGLPVPVAWRAWLLRGKVGAMAAGGEAEGRWNRREEYEGDLRQLCSLSQLEHASARSTLPPSPINIPIPVSAKQPDRSFLYTKMETKQNNPIALPH